MADGKRSLTKPMAELLRPGEELIGGCKAAGKNAVLKGAVGGLASAAIPGSRSGGLGAVVPQDKVFWIGATNQRLVYFDVGLFTSAPKRLQGETPLEAVQSVAVTRQKLSRRLDFAFTDGSSTTVDLYRANSPDQLQAALEQLLPGRVTGSPE
jgi:hypothetical protein